MLFAIFHEHYMKSIGQIREWIRAVHTAIKMMRASHIILEK